MSKWKTKVFGDTHFNFYGMNCMGIVVLGGSFWFVIRALKTGAGHTPLSLLLLAIYFVLLGHFGIAIQNYCARVARVLEEQEAQKKENQATQHGG